MRLNSFHALALLVSWGVISPSLALPVEKTEEYNNLPKDLPKENTGLQQTTSPDGTPGILRNYGPSLGDTTDHKKEALSQNPKLGGPTHITDQPNRPDVFKTHDAKPPKNDDGNKKWADEEPKSSERVAGMSREDQIKQTSLKKVDHQGQSAVHDTPKGPGDQFHGEAPMIRKSHEIAKKMDPKGKGKNVPLYTSAHTGSSPSRSSDSSRNSRSSSRSSGRKVPSKSKPKVRFPGRKTAAGSTASTRKKPATTNSRNRVNKNKKQTTNQPSSGPVTRAQSKANN